MNDAEALMLFARWARESEQLDAELDRLANAMREAGFHRNERGDTPCLCPALYVRSGNWHVSLYGAYGKYGNPWSGPPCNTAGAAIASAVQHAGETLELQRGAVARMRRVLEAANAEG